MFPLATMFDFVQARLGEAGYPLLFGMLWACGLGFPLPEDIPLFFAGYFVADGKMNLAVAAICAWCGIMSGDCCLYALGRRFGPSITRLPVIGRHIDQTRLAWAHEKFEKYGWWVVAVGRMFAGIRGVMVVTAGTIRFTFSHFIIADGLAAIVSGGLFIALGYWGRVKFGDPHRLEADIEHYKTIVTLVVVGLVALWLLWIWWQNVQRGKRKKKLKQQAALREAAANQ